MAGIANDTNGAVARRRAPRHANGGDPKRVWPHNAEIEASILGGIILRNEVLSLVPDIESDTFHDQRHKIIWDAIRNLEHRQQPIDVVTLHHEIEKAGKLDAIGGIAYLGELTLRVPTAENVVYYAADARKLQRNRETIIALGSALERAWTWPHDPAELVSEISGELQRHIDTDAERTPARRARWVTDFEAFLGDDEPDDDDAIDWVVRDLIPRGEPFLIGGPMKAGKTWATIDLALSIVLGEKWLGAFENTFGGPAKVLLVLLEDNKRRVRKRLWELCRARNISPHDPRIVAGLKITRSSLRMPDAKEQRQFTAEVKAWGPAVVIVDNLTRVMVGDPNTTRDASAFSRAWVEVCDDTGAAVGFLHHTRKPGGDQKNQDPFDQLRGSNDFGACARNIIVMTPLPSEDEHLSEVRMRGNLDLRRDSFVLGFERLHMLDRWRARMSDRGEVQNIKEQVSKSNKEAKETRKRDEFLAKLEKRRQTAIAIATREGSVSSARLATEFGLASPNSMKPTMDDLVKQGVLIPAGKRGYTLRDAPHQQTEMATQNP